MQYDVYNKNQNLADKCKETSIESRQTNGQTNAKKALTTPPGQETRMATSPNTTLGEKRKGCRVSGR